MHSPTNRSHELDKTLTNLYREGKHFDRSSLMYDYPGSSGDQSEVVKLLSLQYEKDMHVVCLGLEMGYASFIDCIIGTQRCFRKDLDETVPQVAVYVLLCHYTNIFAIGEYSYWPDGGFGLPGFGSVDNFKTNRTKILSEEISKILVPAAYERVFASELNGGLPEGINTNSNLAGEQQLLFDGYFNWTD